MTPAMVMMIASLALKYGPDFAQGVVALFHQKEVSQEDWNKVFAKAEKSYESYVRGASLPTTTQP